jgi:hypothetical protein
MIEVTIAPTTIPAGRPTWLEVKLANLGQGTYTRIVCTLRLEAGLVRLRGRDKVELSALAAGETFTSALCVQASAPGRYKITSPNFSYRDDRSQSKDDTGVAVEVTADAQQAPPSPDPLPVVTLLTKYLPLGEWNILKGRVTNRGKSDLFELEVVLSGQAITTANALVSQLSAGSSEDMTFHVRALEAGAHVPVRFALSYRGPDGSCSGRAKDTVSVGGGQVTSPGSANPELTRILLLSANPPDTSRIRIDAEIREIQQEIQLGKERDRIRIEIRSAVRPRDITRAMANIRPHFIHFAGHGGGGEESFIGEDGTGEPLVIPVAALANAFKVFQTDVRCVLVNACSTEQLARGLKSVLPDARVIGMRRPVGDRAAIAFSIGFYQAVGAGMGIDDAFSLGLAQVQMTPDDDDSHVPLLL